MVANTGTYIDAPFHRYDEGKDLSQLDMASVANLDGVVFHADTGTLSIQPDLFRGKDLKGKAVLIHTGWDSHWSTKQYFEDHPFLTRESAEYLKAEMGMRRNCATADPPSLRRTLARRNSTKQFNRLIGRLRGFKKALIFAISLLFQVFFSNEPQGSGIDAVS
jgi:kynurenine formamidase